MGNGVKQKQKEMSVKGKSGLNKQNEGSAQECPKTLTVTQNKKNRHCYQRGGPKYNSDLQPQHKKEGNTTVDKIKSKYHETTTTKTN